MEDSVAKLEVTWGRALTVWWSLMWRIIVFGVAAGLVAGAFVGVIAGLTGQADKAKVWGGVAGYIVSVPVPMLVVKIVLQKKWKEFSIGLIPEKQ